MNRQEVIKAVLCEISDETIVVANIADASFELCMLEDRPRNFYMLGSFGMAPSIGLGLALSQRERVVVINGDGALLYNLGCLPTQGRYAPQNLLHVVVDNGAHGSTGYQPTATSAGADLARVAQGCGLEAETVQTLPELQESVRAWFAGKRLAVLVAKTREMPPASAPLVPYSGVQIRDRFTKALRS